MATAAAASAATAVSGGDHARARRAMIDSQLRVSGINDPQLLAAFAAVPREDYVAADQRATAYVDRALPLGGGRSLTAPLSQARLLLEAAPRASDKALLVGGGTGYLAAVLAPLVASLDVVEDAADLPATAPRAGNWHAGDLAAGHAAGAPYDLIVIDGAVEALPQAFAAQLADDGRIVTGTVDRGVTRIAIGRRSGDGIALQPVTDMALPVLAAFATPKEWSF